MLDEIRVLLRHPLVWAAILVWLVLNGAALWLAQGYLPFDRPALAGMSFGQQMAGPTFGLVEVLLLMILVRVLTARRTVPDLAARTPGWRLAAAETSLILAYAALGQAGGWLLGPALGYRPFSFHIAGTLVGCSTPASPGEVWTWATYNFLVFAVVPYLWFRRRYSAEQMNLRSSNRVNDTLVILTVGVVESGVELGVFPGILKLNPHQLLLGAPLAFFVFFIGTVLPTMVLIYALLIPRYVRLTGSSVATVLLGGITYAAMHLVEGWSVFRSPGDTALSLLFVLFQYVGPGMFKSFVTLRTGNAWVHALGYHAIAPHVVVDAPLIVKVFGIP